LSAAVSNPALRPSSTSTMPALHADQHETKMCRRNG
jgi:hypothetical protein